MIQFKKFRYIGLGILVLAIGICCFCPNVSAQIVEIPDPNLRQAIRETLQLPDGVPITQQEMLRLRDLDAGQREITDLTGVEFASNLIGLFVGGNWNNTISSSSSSLNLSPLLNLTKLEVLFIRHSRISDMTPLAKLTQLKGLTLVENGIRDITPLAELVHLRWLTLLENPIADLSPLANLTQLKELQIRAGRITDITPLANLTNLVMLNLHGNQIVDISPLASLTQLEKLVIDSNQIVDISPLANLTGLKELKIDRNRIVDFSPLQGLSLTNLRYDEVCELPDPPVQDRIQNRTLPSIPQPFGHTVLNLPALSLYDRMAYHDLHWQHLPFGLRFQQTPPWYQLVGDVDRAIAQREELLARNPNMLFLVELRLRMADPYLHYPKDWFGWLRDENGNLIKTSSRPDSRHYFIDFRLPEVQDIIVQQTISVAQCGLYDGIMFDAGWSDMGRTLVSLDDVPDSERQYYSTFEEEIEARLSMIQRIRANVPDDFLILCNSNWAKLPITGSYINGGFMETLQDGYDVYQNKTLAEIEDALLWYEANVREPRINTLSGQGILTEPPDSPNNRRWMRFFTTMSLTLSDGYVLYTLGGRYSRHIWYPFWGANLGQPVGRKAQPYQNVPGLYIREFTNGWAVYNRSGQAQTITLPSSASSVSDRGSNDAFLTHLLPDLDGEIYIATRSFADVNSDGAVNILDLVMVANGFGQSAPDPNGDGAVNVLDLVFVAQQFSQ